MKAIVVYLTAPNYEEAERLAHILVKERLAACVQILPQITSVYRWKGAVQQETEILILVKTTNDKFAALEKTVRANHSYETPEIVAVPAEQVSEPYLLWLEQSTRE